MKFKEKLNQAAGFTLVELIVVIAILAILAGVAVPAYSGYITQANKSNDETLASEIKNALMLGYYNGTLKPGASVTVYYEEGKPAVAYTNAEGDDMGAAQAMRDAFGDNWQSLKLSWDGWKNEMSVAADKEMMNYVNQSNFGRDNLENMLSQVDTVVGAAGNYLIGVGSLNPDAPQWEYLKNAEGVVVGEDGAVTEANVNAIANATVFTVADEIAASVDLSDTSSIWNDALKVMQMWGTGDFSSTNWDGTSQAAAAYAATLALASYVDNTTGKTTFNAQLNKTDAVGKEILTNRIDVYNAILGSTDEDVKNAVVSYYGYDLYADVSAVEPKTSDPFYRDAMAFIAYMQGVSSSAESMMENNDLNSGSYFSDGTVLGYVKNYVSLSDVIPADATNGAFVFYFDGNQVACLPLDY